MRTISDELRSESDHLFELLATLVEPTIAALEKSTTEDKNEELLRAYYCIKQQLDYLRLEGASHLGICQFFLSDKQDSDPEQQLLAGILGALQQQDYIETVEDTAPMDRDLPPQ